MSIKLRKFELEDAQKIAELVRDEAVSKWTSNIPFPYSELDAIDWIRRTSSDSSRHPFAVELNGELVACVSYWPYESSAIEVGFWVGKDFWGKGVCTIALKLLLSSNYFPAEKDVFARIMANNAGPRRVLEKCGFSFLKNGAFFRGNFEAEARVYVRRVAT